VLERLYPALGAANTFRLRGVTLSGLARFLDIHPLSDVRCGIQISVMSNTA
jgi:hypothetical protein